MCLTFSLYKKFKATLTHDIHWISVFTNQGVNHGKHRHQPFQKLAQLWYLSLASFALSKFSQFNPWVDNHATCLFKVLCILSCWIKLTCLPENAHVNSVGTRFHSIRCLFYFHSSTGNIYKYKGKYLFRRISHAFSGSKLQLFRYLE